MSCETATALMLEADLSELEGLGDTELAAHLGRCAACRERARRIVATERALGEALDGMHARVDAHERGARAHDADKRRDRLRRRRGRRVLGRAWIPLALAAGLAALMLIPHSGQPPELPSPVSIDADALRLRVDVPAGRSAVLYETDNPDVIVVWFY